MAKTEVNQSSHGRSLWQRSRMILAAGATIGVLSSCGGATADNSSPNVQNKGQINTSSELFLEPTPTPTLIPTPTEEAPKKEGLKTFKSPLLSYEVDVPASWKITPLEDLGYAGINGDIFEIPTDSPRENYLQVTTSRGTFSMIRDVKAEHDYFDSKTADLYPNKIPPTTFIKTEEVNLDGAPAILITQQFDKSTMYESSYILMFNGPASDKSGKTWGWHILYSYSPERGVSHEEAEGMFKNFMDNFRLPHFEQDTPQPVEKAVSISKNPDQLHQSLLTSDVPEALLPTGITLKGKYPGKMVSDVFINLPGRNKGSVEADIFKTFKAIGQVNVTLLDTKAKRSSNNDNTANSVISYIIFPDPSSAEGAYKTLTSSTNSELPVKDPLYPTFGIINSTMTESEIVLVKQIENTLMVTTLLDLTIDPNISVIEKETMSLAKIGVEILREAGK